MAEHLRDEFVIRAEGTVRKRGEGLENPNIPTGDIEIKVQSMEVLGACNNALPFEIADAQNPKEELRLKYRYLDIRRNHKHGIELKIMWDRVYFRFRCGEIFEPPMFAKGLSREVLKGYYSQIYYPLELLDKTIESINEIH